MSEVVQGYIPVVTRSGRNWAKCPFHGNGNERTPSFAINDRDGFYHCFGCGESGDMFTFVEKMDHVSFNEAVEILAHKAGVELEVVVGKTDRKDKDEIETLYDLNKRIAGTFHYLLLNSAEAAVANINAFLSTLSPVHFTARAPQKVSPAATVSTASTVNDGSLISSQLFFI